MMRVACLMEPEEVTYMYMSLCIIGIKINCSADQQVETVQPVSAHNVPCN